MEMFRAAAAVNNSLGQIIRQEHVLARFKFLEKMIAFQKKARELWYSPRYFVSKVIIPRAQRKSRFELGGARILAERGCAHEGGSDVA